MEGGRGNVPRECFEPLYSRTYNTSLLPIAWPTQDARFSEPVGFGCIGRQYIRVQSQDRVDTNIPLACLPLIFPVSMRDNDIDEMR